MVGLEEMSHQTDICIGSVEETGEESRHTSKMKTTVLQFKS